MSFCDSEYAGKRKRTRVQTVPAEMEQIIPWTILLNLIEPVCPKAGYEPCPFPLSRTVDGDRVTVGDDGETATTGRVLRVKGRKLPPSRCDSSEFVVNSNAHGAKSHFLLAMVMTCSDIA
jgi:hypothetical protein